MREFKNHKGILFDEATCSMVLAQKKLFQAPAVYVRLGCSTTNCHAYDVFVSGVALMISSNTWVTEHAALKREADRNWIANNSILVDVGSEPLWVEAKDEL